MKEQSVAVVSASAMVGEAMADTLQRTTGFGLSGTWTSRDAAFDAWVVDRPDVAMIDRPLLGFDPLGFVEGVRDSLGVPLLIRATDPTVEYAHLVIAAGAGGVVCTSAGGDAVLETIAEVATTPGVVPVALRDALHERLIRGETLSYRSLSVQERRVAGYVASGATARQAADRLFVTEATVRKHLNHIYEKLGVSGREGLLVVLIQLGVIDVDGLGRGGRALALV